MRIRGTRAKGVTRIIALFSRAQTARQARPGTGVGGALPSPFAPTGLLDRELRTQRDARGDTDRPGLAATGPAPRTQSPTPGPLPPPPPASARLLPASCRAGVTDRWAPPAPLPPPRPHVRRVCLFSCHGNARGAAGGRREERQGAGPGGGPQHTAGRRRGGGREPRSYK